MNKVFISVIAMLMIFGLSACGSQGKPDPTNSDTFTPTQNKEQDDNTSDEATVSVAYADEELLASYDDYDEYIDYASEYQVKLVFTANTAVSDFKFLKLSFIDVDESEYMSFDVEELQAANELSPQRPLVIGMTFIGTVPDRGISYVGTDGTTKYYAVSMSGDDGSPMLIEFKK